MPAVDWDALRASLAGDVLTPHSPGYDAARRPAIANFQDVRPRAVVRCRNAADVAETIAFATHTGIAWTPRSGGHSFAGRSSTDGIVLDVGPMSAVSVTNGVATAGAGTRLGTLYDLLGEHRVTIPAGCGPDVGIAGLTLGGGLGILGRQYGLTSDRLVGVEVVLADGRVVRCAAENEPDLFWALRGAGGCRFGVVTALDLATVPAAATTTFHLTWPARVAAEVVDAWQRWAPAAPDELAASLLIRATGEADEPPKLHVFGAMTGSRSDAAPFLDDLVVRTGVDPGPTLVAEGSHRESKQWLAELFPGDDDGSAHLYSKAEFFDRPLPSDGIESLLARLVDDRRPDETRTLDFMPWDGAYGRTPVEATAFPHRRARFLLKHEVATPASRSDAGLEWLTASWTAVHPWGTGGAYVNFPDADLDDWATAYHGPNLDRLRRIKARYDPDGVFGSTGRSNR